MFFLLLSVAGLFVGVICLISIKAAHTAIEKLDTQWRQWAYANGVIRDFPQLTGGGDYHATHRGHGFAKYLQLCFIGFWLTVGILLGLISMSRYWLFHTHVNLLDDCVLQRHLIHSAGLPQIDIDFGAIRLEYFAAEPAITPNH